MKFILWMCSFMLVSLCTQGQDMKQSVWVVDYVKVKDGKMAETQFYYEQNWKRYREEALKLGYIKSYKILKTDPAQQNAFDLMLMTEYADQEQLSKAEEHFQPIIKRLNPDGPKLLNELKPGEFRQNVYNYTFTQAAPATN